MFSKRHFWKQKKTTQNDWNCRMYKFFGPVLATTEWIFSNFCTSYDNRRRYFFCGSFMLFLSYVCYAFLCLCLLMRCGHLLGKGWLLALVCDVLFWVCYFPIGILGQVWYLIISIPDLCPLLYFYCMFTSNTFALDSVVGSLLNAKTTLSAFLLKQYTE